MRWVSDLCHVGDFCGKNDNIKFDIFLILTSRYVALGFLCTIKKHFFLMVQKQSELTKDSFLLTVSENEYIYIYISKYTCLLLFILDGALIALFLLCMFSAIFPQVTFYPTHNNFSTVGPHFPKQSYSFFVYRNTECSHVKNKNPLHTPHQNLVAF